MYIILENLNSSLPTSTGLKETIKHKIFFFFLGLILMIAYEELFNITVRKAQRFSILWKLNI